jgi:AcrR family transcriptional regulator
MATRLDRETRREQLIAVGAQMFAGRSYDDVWMDEVAAEVGASKALLYHYFPSKRDFYVAVIRDQAERMREITEPDPELEPLDRLRAGVERFLDYAEAHAAGFRTLHRGGLGSDAQIRAIIDEAHTRHAERLLAGIGAEGAARELVGIAVRGWLALATAATVEWLEGRSVTRTQLRDLLVGALVGTVAAAHDAAAP